LNCSMVEGLEFGAITRQSTLYQTTKKIMI
jgi:hypothetical protein